MTRWLPSSLDFSPEKSGLALHQSLELGRPAEGAERGVGPAVGAEVRRAGVLPATRVIQGEGPIEGGQRLGVHPHDCAGGGQIVPRLGAVRSQLSQLHQRRLEATGLLQLGVGVMVGEGVKVGVSVGLGVFVDVDVAVAGGNVLDGTGVGVSTIGGKPAG